MSGTTEIYICQPGQAVTEGRIVYGNLTTRAEAEDDAADRIRMDPSIGKIAYYAIRPDGEFKLIYTKRNENPTRAKRISSKAVRNRNYKRHPVKFAKPSKPSKPSKLRRLLDVFK